MRICDSHHIVNDDAMTNRIFAFESQTAQESHAQYIAYAHLKRQQDDALHNQGRKSSIRIAEARTLSRAKEVRNASIGNSKAGKTPSIRKTI